MIEFTNLSEQGFMPISRVFLTNYRKLNISMEEAMLVLHLLDHSWFGNRDFPSAEYFAKMSGKSGQTVRAYLFTIARNTYLQWLRKTRREVALEDTHTNPSPGPDQLVANRLELQQAHKLLQTLPEIDRTAFVLRVQHELPYAEIARVLGLSLSAAKVKVHRVRRRLLATRTGEGG